MRPWVRLALLASAYFASHAAGYLFLSQVEGISPIWPASGVGLALLLLGPKEEGRKSLAVLGGVTLCSNLLLSGAFGASLGFTLANVLEFAGGALVLRGAGTRSLSFSRVDEVVRLALVAGLVTLPPALVGAGTAVLTGGAPFVSTLFTWWIADGLGVLLVTPLILGFASSAQTPREVRSSEALMLALAWTLAAWVTFRANVPLGPLVPQPYMLLPLLAWTALRLGTRGVTSALLAIASVAIASTLLSHDGAFAWGLPSVTDRLLTTQIYLAIASVTSLLLAASTTEMKRLERTARQGEARLEKAEAEARSNAEWLHLALDAAHMGTWEWDVASNRVRWSDGVARLFGLEAGAFAGTYDAYLALIHPEDRALFLEQLGAALGGEVPEYCVDHRVVWPDGSVHWLEGKGSVRRDGEGRPLRMTGTVVEISARKQAELELTAGEERLRNFIRHTPAAVAMFDTEMRYLHVAERWLTDYHLDGQNVIGRSHYEVFPDIPEHWKAIHQRGLAGAIERCDEDPFERADGSVEWLQWEVRPWRKAGGEIGGVIMFTHVITERKRLQEKLRQTQKLEALGTLAGGIAHDFNNILGAMLAFTELTRLENPGNPALQENLREVTLAGARAAGLVRQILSFSRQQPQERKPMLLTPVIEEVLKLLRSTLPATLELDADLPAVLPVVMADATQMHQVVMNVCTNAAQAMHGRGRLGLRLDVFELAAGDVGPHPRLQPGEYLRLVIDDTGHGMDAVTLGRAFEPFFTTKKPGAGTGLGLAVAHGIVNDHDGTIGVESAVGRGTSVTIHLPIARASTPAPERRISEATPRGSGERILFVDDEQALCTAASAILSRAGYEPIVCRDSEEAWRRVEREPDSFALVVSDLTMPGMTGLDLAAKIHALRPNLPILLTSGHAGGLTAQGLRDLGVSDLLEKPFDYQALTRRIARMVQREEDPALEARAAS